MLIRVARVIIVLWATLGCLSAASGSSGDPGLSAFLTWALFFAAPAILVFVFPKIAKWILAVLATLMLFLLLAINAVLREPVTEFYNTPGFAALIFAMPPLVTAALLFFANRGPRRRSAADDEDV
ncbi:MAG: hypothetical protein H6813_06125 [Phycisphaeraceae bacterium]|nr:hypothetical protein [Phycisphaeraceae bacterium]MCB9848047.1 hypothetical protein [Phycisphaeraceae bacterium]